MESEGKENVRSEAENVRTVFGKSGKSTCYLCTTEASGLHLRADLGLVLLDLSFSANVEFGK